MTGVGSGGVYVNGRGVRVASLCVCNRSLGSLGNLDGAGGAGWGTDGTWLYTASADPETSLIRLLLSDMTTTETLYTTAGTDEVRSCCIDSAGYMYWVEENIVSATDITVTTKLRKRLIAGGSITDLLTEVAVRTPAAGPGTWTGKRFDGICWSEPNGLLYMVRYPGGGTPYTTELLSITTAGTVTVLDSHTGSGATQHYYENKALTPTADGSIWGYAYDDTHQFIFRWNGAVSYGDGIGDFLLFPSGPSEVTLVGFDVTRTFDTSLTGTDTDCPSRPVEGFSITWAASPDFSTVLYSIVETNGPDTYGLHKACPAPPPTGSVNWDPILQVVATGGSPNVDVIDGIFKAAFGPGSSTGTWSYSDATTGTWSNSTARAWPFSMTLTWADQFNQVGTRTVRVISNPSGTIQDFTVAAGTNLDTGGNTVSIHSGTLTAGSTGFTLQLRIDGTGSGTHMGLRLGRPRQFLITA